MHTVIPYARVSGSAEFDGVHERNISGFGDPQLRFSYNFFGAPALSLKKFFDYQQNIVLGASLQVTAPLGQYDPDRLLNIGTNRWTIKSELGFSKTIGPLIFELAAGASFFTDNNDLLGEHTQSQDPIYSIQGHIIYSMPSGIVCLPAFGWPLMALTIAGEVQR